MSYWIGKVVIKTEDERGKVKKTKMMAKGGKVKGTKMYSKGGKVSKGR